MSYPVSSNTTFTAGIGVSAPTPPATSGGALPGAAFEALSSTLTNWHVYQGALTEWQWVTSNNQSGGGLERSEAGERAGAGGLGGSWTCIGTDFFFSYAQSTTWLADSMNVRKVMADSTGIDSRKVAGPPNVDGALPGLDPNADLKNATFRPWFYKGGNWVGNMPGGQTDQSGLGRTQFYFPANSLNASTAAASLSLMYLGYPASAPQDETVNLYAPSVADPNLTLSSASATWQSQWLTSFVLQGVQYYAPQLGSYSLTSSSPTNNYCCYSFAPSSWPIPPNGTTNLFLVSSLEGSSQASWKYFASPSYLGSLPSDQQVYPLTDSLPRLWLSDLTFSTWTL